MSEPLDVSLRRCIRTVPDFPEPGIQFKDFTPLLRDASLTRQVVEALAHPFLPRGITCVVGVESRGFILGGMLAQTLGVGFVPVRKKGKLPYSTFSETYALEYGVDVLELHTDALAPDERVLVHDDVLATGGTLAATCRLVEKAGAEVIGCSLLMELAALSGRTALPRSVQVEILLTL